MKTGTLTIMMALLVQFTFAQMNMPELNFFKTDELTELIKRPLLIVESTEAKIKSNDIQKKLEKAKDEKRDELNAYNEILLESDQVLRTHFLNIVKENWKFNDLSEIRVITPEEAWELRKAKNNQYCLIMLRPFPSTIDIVVMQKKQEPANGSYPGISIQGSENYASVGDQMGFPLIRSTEGAYSKDDVEITVRILNNHVEQALKAPKRLGTSDFVEQQISENCEMKKSLKLQVNDAILNDISPSEVSAVWPGTVNIEPTSSFLSTYTSSSNDAFAVFIVTGHMSSSGVSALTTMNAKTTIYGRMVVQPSTGKILGFSKSKMGKKVGEQDYDSKHFEETASCK
jgi:hypothetical protein